MQNSRSIEPLSIEDESQERINSNTKRSLEVGVVDSVNILGIYTQLVDEKLRPWIEKSGPIMFPLAAALSAIQMLLAWRQAYLEKGKKGSLGRAILETLCTGAVIAAVILGSAVAGFIFTGMLALRTLYHAGSAIYYAGKAAATTNSGKKQEYQGKAKTNAISTLTCAVSTVACGLVMIASKFIFAAVGIGACLIGIGFMAHARYKMSQAKSASKTPEMNKRLLTETDEAPEQGLTNGARLHKQFQPTSHGSSVAPSAGVNQSVSSRRSVRMPQPVIDESKGLAAPGLLRSASW